MKIGERLRQLRVQQNLSLEQLARKVGLTRSFLSQIENDKTSPSIATLIKLLNVHNVTMADFFQSIEKTRSVVVKKGQMKLFHDQESGTRIASLAAGFDNPRISPFYVEMDAGGSSEVYVSQGQNFCYILSGTIRLTLGGQGYILEQGDSVYFDSAVPHQWAALSLKVTGIYVTDESVFSTG